MTVWSLGLNPRPLAGRGQGVGGPRNRWRNLSKVKLPSHHRPPTPGPAPRGGGEVYAHDGFAP
jgi:hypothetical protein